MIAFANGFAKIHAAAAVFLGIIAKLENAIDKPPGKCYTNKALESRYIAG